MTQMKMAPATPARVQGPANQPYNKTLDVHDSDVKTPPQGPVRIGSKVVGHIEGDQFVKYIRGSIHRLRKPPAFCLSEHAFHVSVLPWVSFVRVIDIETTTHYEVATGDFLQHAFRIHRGDYEPQLALPLKWWHVVFPGGVRA